LGKAGRYVRPVRNVDTYSAVRTLQRTDGVSDCYIPQLRLQYDFGVT